MNNISFQGKTNLLFDNAIYNVVTTRHRPGAFTNLNLSAGSNYKIRNARFIAYDPNEVCDTAVLIRNERFGMFFHNAQEKILEILDCISMLKENAKENLTAWIIGGQKGIKTTKDVNVLAEVLCDRPDIDTSIIAGQRLIAPNITIHPTIEKFELSIGAAAPKAGENVERNLENYFDIVELNNTIVS